MIKLSPLQKKVLGVISMDCRIEVEEVARQVSARPHQVRYVIDRLQDLLSLSPYCLTNPFRRGLVPYSALFSIDNSELSHRTEMIEYLGSRPEVFWLHELYGYYQFIMTIWVPDSQHLHAFLHDFDSRFGSLIVSRSLREVSRNVLFTPAVAQMPSKQRISRGYLAERSVNTLDSIDRDILEALHRSPLASSREIARSLGQPASTIGFRTNRLIKEGVIISCIYDYDARLAGTESYLALVKLNGLGGGLSDGFFEFARQHPRINRIARLLGDWDLEIDLELDEPHELNHIIHQIFKHGNGSVKDVLCHSWGKELRTFAHKRP
jgi:DNA-binding Lrp family transcriptional regulator